MPRCMILALLVLACPTEGGTAHQQMPAIQSQPIDSRSSEHYQYKMGLDYIDAPFTMQVYNLHITPQVTNLNPRFSGRVELHFSCHRSASFIELHATHLTLKDYSLTDRNDPSQYLAITLTELPEKQRLRFDLTGNILPGGQYTMYIQYEGQFNLDGFTTGVFTDAYFASNTSGILHYMMGTTLRPNHARSFFPCIDSPDHKSKFRLSVTREHDWKVLSNTHLKNTAVHDDDSATDVFAETEYLSTFHLVVILFPIGDWIVADIKYVQNTSCNLWMPKYNSLNGRDLLQYVDQDIQFLSRYTGINMQFEKMDFFSFLGYHTTAFEHPGLITLRNNIIQPSNPDQFYFPAKTVTHELTHQWFGNFITPRSWGDLWISEGLTTYVTYKATQNHHANFHEYSVKFHASQLTIMYIDGFPAAGRPIHQYFEEIPEYTNIYHALTWTKGYALAKILESVVGEDIFQRVLQSVLSQNRWGVITVWEFLEQLEELTSGQIEAVSAWQWFTKTGYPIITASKAGNVLTLEILHLNSNINNITLDKMDNFHGLLNLDYEIKYLDGSRKEGQLLFRGNGRQLTVTLESEDIEYVFINTKGLYCRVLYDSVLWQHLVDNINTKAVLAHYKGRVSAMDDAYILSRFDLLDHDIFSQIMNKTCHNATPIHDDSVTCSVLWYWVGHSEYQ